MSTLIIPISELYFTYSVQKILLLLVFRLSDCFLVFSCLQSGAVLLFLNEHTALKCLSTDQRSPVSCCVYQSVIYVLFFWYLDRALDQLGLHSPRRLSFPDLSCEINKLQFILSCEISLLRRSITSVFTSSLSWTIPEENLPVKLLTLALSRMRSSEGKQLILLCVLLNIFPLHH